MLGWLIILSVVGCQLPENGQQIAYIGWDAADRKQIFLTDQSATPPRQLTDSLQDISGFAVSPDGEQIVYTVQLDNGSELWRLGLGRLFTSPKIILTCPNAICSQPIWAADGQRLIYEKRPLLNEYEERGSPSLHWLDVESGTTATVQEEAGSPTHSARFSPDGNWISYVSPADEGVIAYHFDNGSRPFEGASRFLTIPSLIGSPAAWHPASNQLVVADLNNTIQHGEEGDDHQSHAHDVSPAINLFMTNLETEERTLLTKATGVDDGTAVISPMGEWIAFGRKPNQTATGRQIWLIRPDGSDVHALTNELLVHFGSLGWSDNGHTILFQRFDSGSASRPNHPSIHIIDITTNAITNIAPAGFHPIWIPNS